MAKKRVKKPDQIVFEKFSKEAFLKALEEAEKKREIEFQAELAKRRARDEDSGKVCVVCKHPILTRYRHHRRDPYREPIGCHRSKFDPGPMPYTDGYHCSNPACGLEYHHLPKDNL